MSPRSTALRRSPRLIDEEDEDDDDDEDEEEAKEDEEEDEDEAPPLHPSQSSHETHPASLYRVAGMLGILEGRSPLRQ